MERINLTNGLYSADQAALNEMTVKKIETMLENKAPKIKEAVAKLIEEGKMLKDYVAPLGTNHRSEPTRIMFDSNGSVKMAIKGKGEFSMHPHAIGQTAAKLGVPTQYIRSLAEGDEWQRQLAAKILNEHSGWSDRSRILIRTVGNEVRGVMSDHYRRLNTMDVITSFLNTVQENGGILADGFFDDTRFSFETIVDTPIVVPTKKNGLISLAFGAKISSSDFGDGSLQINTFVLQGICLNGLIRQNVLRQVHLGGRLPDNLELSERTYRYDTKTMASAVKDMTTALFQPDRIRKEIIAIQEAADTEVDMEKKLKSLQRDKMTKAEVKEVEAVLMNGNPNDGVAGEATLWKLVNGITAVAREKEPRRMRELQEIAGNLI